MCTGCDHAVKTFSKARQPSFELIAINELEQTYPLVHRSGHHGSERWENFRYRKIAGVTGAAGGIAEDALERLPKATQRLVPVVKAAALRPFPLEISLRAMPSLIARW